MGRYRGGYVNELAVWTHALVGFVGCGIASPLLWPKGHRFVPVSSILGAAVGFFMACTVGVVLAWLGQRKARAAFSGLVWTPTVIATIVVSMASAPGMPVTSPVVCAACSLLMAMIGNRVLRDIPERRGICQKCGYDLAGISSGVCPECGDRY